MTDQTRFVVAGTAGHIDHGKTELVRALTGTWTDRLKEEQERGISIDLGFAELRLGDDVVVGLVDVPGHERFVRNMLAGVGGIDFVVLVIAADEGVMPQTREHLDIIDLLGVKRGVVALTKADLVDDPEWMELVQMDVAELLEGTGLAGAPMVAVSSLTGAGLDELRGELQKTAQAVTSRDASGDFRLPIDRVFTVRGFGTVVTGTLWSGSVSVGDTVAIEPGELRARVRNVQVHGLDQNRARAGQRVALALVGVEREELFRGGTVCRPGSLVPSYMIDARVRVLDDRDKPLVHRQRVHFHQGTSEALARVVPLDAEAIQPGETALVQIRLESPMALLPGDRFVLRHYSPVTTIAGGIVLDPWARKHRPHRSEVLRGLDVRERGEPEEIAAEVVRDAGPAGLDRKDQRLLTAICNATGTDTQVGEVLESAADQAQIVELLNHRLVATRYVDSALALLSRLVDQHHRKHPLQTGFPSSEAGSRLSKEQPGLPGEAVVELACRRGVVVKIRDRIAHPEFRVELSAEDENERERLRQIFGGEQRHSPPSPEQAIEPSKDPSRARNVLHAMLDAGELVRLTRDLIMTRAALDEIEQGVAEMLEGGQAIAVADVRGRFGCTRKYLIPLLEHLDRQGLTKRQGDLRVAGAALNPERGE